jgi:predicted DNA-binding protein (MmcQ/YjbR family)
VTLLEFEALCAAKPGVTADYPGKGEVVWMKVGGKMFAMTNVKPMMMEGVKVMPFHFINLKCDPDRSDMLRATHANIRPAWHQNKTHWNSIYMNGDVGDDLISELTEHSYELALKLLPKKIRELLA